MHRFRLLSLAAIALGGILWWIALPAPLTEAAVEGLTGDPLRGRTVFLATGCASCHIAPGAEEGEAPVLSGGQAFPSPFGTFHAPNISQDTEQGIGDWSLAEFASAVMRGVGREGQHLYPALPYVAYGRMELQDVADLHAYMKTLPADPAPSLPHEVPFPFNLRAGLGLWKLLFVPGDWAVPDPLPSEAARGRYIAEAMAHCAECHTPRNRLGGLDRGRWLAGAPRPSGKGKVPALLPSSLGWTAEEIAHYLTTGMTPDYDSVGGAMAHVVDNFARLPPDYPAAVAAYLKALP